MSGTDPPEQSYTNTTSRCRYRLDTESSAIFVLPAGRELGYAQYGPPSGNAVFYLHGLPGSRLEASLWEEEAKKFNIRIIAIDRPGIGRSAPVSNRTLLDHAKDVERLAEHLGLDEYGAMGVSGGGPYALACARSLPRDRLKVVTIVCGLGLSDMSKRGMGWKNWLGFAAGWYYFPKLVRWWMSREPAAQLHLPEEERLRLLKEQSWMSIMAPKNLEAFEDDDLLRLSLRSTEENLKQGFTGMLQDGRVVCQTPGFRVEDIPADLPLQLWYGKDDKNVGLVGEEIAERFSGDAEFHLEDETHASIVVNCRERILKGLAEKMSE